MTFTEQSCVDKIVNAITHDHQGGELCTYPRIHKELFPLSPLNTFHASSTQQNYFCDLSTHKILIYSYIYIYITDFLQEIKGLCRIVSFSLCCLTVLSTLRNGSVHWGKDTQVDDISPILARINFKNYTEQNVMVGNALKYEAEVEVNMVTELRAELVKMSVVAIPNSNNQHYAAYFQLAKLKELKRILKNNHRLLVTWVPRPATVEPSQKQLKDSVRGWNAWITEDALVDHGADVAAFLERPTNSANPTKDREIKTGTMFDQDLPFRFVYIKLRVDVTTVKDELKTLDKLHFTRTGKNEKAKLLRELIYARVMYKNKTVDLLEGFDGEGINMLIKGLISNQQAFFLGSL